ncbi:hypothetical protein [Sediminimonas qiaohouensis]|uniref:hypothetical protein n=1 Tax=Sediminimonas qiaohouensis TaxID=552061 RepID=UPI00041EDE48|nr:hypothetical protein [Sediminimonas qiaohouensis]
MMVHRAIHLAALALALGGLGACGAIKDRVKGIGGGDVLFDGRSYSASLSADRDDPAAFTVSVANAGGARLAGAREAGRYEATKHCIEITGNSRVVWSTGPDAPAEALTLSDGALLLAGRCAG